MITLVMDISIFAPKTKTFNAVIIDTSYHFKSSV